MNFAFDEDQDRVIRCLTVKVAEPDIHDPASDARRLEKALADQHGIFGTEIPLGVLATLQRVLRRGDWSVSVVINGRHIVALEVPFGAHKSAVKVDKTGLVLDIGVSWVEIQLVDLETGATIVKTSLVNPLVRFGVDPISRIAHGMTTPSSLAEMTSLLRATLDGAVGSLAMDAVIDRCSIVDIVFVADPVTHHLLLGLDPSELGSAPYTQAISEPLDVLADALGLHVAKGALVHALPLLGGQVGSDNMAAAYWAGVGQDERVTLLIDIGTTTEIVLGSKGKVLAAAPPAGAALQGVQIEAGRHAVPGAIDAIRIDPQTFEPRFRVIGSPYWSDEPDFAASVETLDLGGFCRSGLMDALAELRLSGLMGRDGALDPEKGAVTPRIREEYRSSTYLVREDSLRIALTQHDIRSLQMAKAAVQAAARILLKRHGGLAIDRVVITGGSGAAIDPLRAAIVGLFPDCDLDQVSFIENAALEGAKAALMSRSTRLEMTRLARQTRVIETVLDADFQIEQIGAMGLPHSRLGYPLLGARVDLPDNEPVTRGRRTERRGRSSG